MQIRGSPSKKGFETRVGTIDLFCPFLYHCTRTSLSCMCIPSCHSSSLT
jgi:hypothetical protein